MIRRLPLLAALALFACSSSPPVSPPPADGAAGDDASADVTVSPDVAAEAAVDRAPTGVFTAVPYRSAEPMRMFPGAEQILMAGRDYRAVLELSQLTGEPSTGRVVLDLDERAPLAVNSFVYLSLHHFYEGIAFHRVLEGFVAQAGDPNTLTDNRARWGTGGPGYGFDTEPVEGLGFDGPGVLGMARSQARDSNGSQFFITFAAQRSLTGNYTVFGRVTEGMDVLSRIARNQAMTTPPMTPTRITRVTIEAR